MNIRFLFLAVVSLGIFSSCTKDNPVTTAPPVTPNENKVVLNFENYVGAQPLQLNGPDYVSGHGDTFKVTLYKYYVSNIVFVKDNGEEYAEPESYHLMNQADLSSLTFAINDVPAGDYTSIRLLMGVDSTHNVTGAQSGDLDPSFGMFWNWNSGYIMAKIEGTSPQVPSLLGHSFSFHLGGFSGPYSVLQQVSLPLPQALSVTGTGNHSITIKSDVLKWFDTPNVVDFSTLNQVGLPGVDANKISVNYRRMLSVTNVEN